jgi:hypothetical protein
MKEIEGDKKIIDERNINLFGLTNHKALEDVQIFLFNYFDYGIGLDSPEYVCLKQIFKTLEISLNNNSPLITEDVKYEITKEDQDKIDNYVTMFKECFYGSYHGRQSYVTDIDGIEEEESSSGNIEEMGKSFRNLPEEEQEIIKLIKSLKVKTEKKLEFIISQYKNNKKQALHLIAKIITKKETDMSKILEYYQKDELDNLINYIKSLYTNNKPIKTLKDFKEKIIDDTVLTGINSIIS